MIDKYHNAWIIRDLATRCRIYKAEIRSCRCLPNMIYAEKKALLNSIYGCRTPNPVVTIMELTGDYLSIVIPIV